MHLVLKTVTAKGEREGGEGEGIACNRHCGRFVEITLNLQWTTCRN